MRAEREGIAWLTGGGNSRDETLVHIYISHGGKTSVLGRYNQSKQPMERPGSQKEAGKFRK
jgi:hypothetical protein